MMQIIKLPTENFSTSKMQNKMANGELKDNLDVLRYIYSYYFEVKAGKYYFYDYEMDTFEFKTEKDFQLEIANKLQNKDVANALKRNNRIFKIICAIGKPRIYSDNDNLYLNESGAFMHTTYKKFDDYSSKIKKRAQIFFDMIKTISCNNDEKMYDCTMLAYAQIARGQRTNVILAHIHYLQGLGKTTEFKFMTKHVYGDKVCVVCTNADSLLTSNNKILLGKLIVVYEDLEDLTANEGKKVTQALKVITTEDKLLYADKYEKSIECKNITNVFVTTNFDLRDARGRRIIPKDISTIRQNDREYWTYFYKHVMNNEVGECVYSYLMTKITDEQCNNFKAQNDFPNTEKKLLAISHTLDSPYKFLRDCHILQKNGIAKIERAEFFKQYQSYCSDPSINCKATNKINFFDKLKDVDIISHTTGKNKYYYTMSCKELNNIATKHKWICKYDDYNENKDEDDNENKTLASIKYVEDYEIEVAEYKNELKALKKEMKSLKKQIIKQEVKEEPKEIIKETKENKKVKTKTKSNKDEDDMSNWSTTENTFETFDDLGAFE